MCMIQESLLVTTSYDSLLIRVNSLGKSFISLVLCLHSNVILVNYSEELGMRFAASQMAIVSLLRTWTGLLHIFHAKDMIKSFVQSLLIPNSTIRVRVLWSVMIGFLNIHF